MITQKDDCLIAGGTLLSYRGKKEKLEYPSCNDPDPVYRIGNGAMMNNHTLRKITLRRGISEIGAHAFDGCLRLENVWLPASVRNVDPTAFLHDERLRMISFYVRIPSSKFYEIRENAILLTNDQYILDPLSLDHESNELIRSLMPGVSNAFPSVREEMGYFFCMNACNEYDSYDRFAFSAFCKARNISPGLELDDENRAMQYRILNGEENLGLSEQMDTPISIPSFCNGYPVPDLTEIPATALLFMDYCKEGEEDGKILVRMALRKGYYFYHCAHKVFLGQKAYYVYFRLFFGDEPGVPYIRKDSSMAVFTKDGRLKKDDKHREEVMNKFRFISNYL